jgi:hypothetical protein
VLPVQRILLNRGLHFRCVQHCHSNIRHSRASDIAHQSWHWQSLVCCTFEALAALQPVFWQLIIDVCLVCKPMPTEQLTCECSGVTFARLLHWDVGLSSKSRISCPPPNHGSAAIERAVGLKRLVEHKNHNDWGINCHVCCCHACCCQVRCTGDL